MANNLNYPKEYDAVMGGTNPPPIYGAVLGGIDGIKKRLASSVVEGQIAALSDALNYGDIGLDLALQALQDESMQVQLAAYSLLKDRQESRVKVQLESFDDLRSDVGVDYRKLRELLAAEKWIDADRETLAVMVKAVRTTEKWIYADEHPFVVMFKAARTTEDWLDTGDIKYFPCTDLRTIDALWVKYSKGLFGFSVQKRIWQELGSKVDYETNCHLGDRVGWRKNSKWGQDYDRLICGHLPSVAVLCERFDYDSYGDIAFGWGEWRVTGWSADNGFAEDWCGSVRFISHVASRLVNCDL